MQTMFFQIVHCIAIWILAGVGVLVALRFAARLVQVVLDLLIWLLEVWRGQGD